MPLSDHKTKIVATIGPASNSPEMLRQLIQAGMNVARINFSHGEFSLHAQTIARLREAERSAGKRVAVMADLPGPKMRIGMISAETMELTTGSTFTLTTEEIVGTIERVTVSFKALPAVVNPGDKLFLNDGLIHLQVERIIGNEVVCTVVVGGELRSRKGLNLPGINLGISAFTDHDRVCLAFALQHGVDAVSQSFVERAADMHAVRDAAKALGKDIFIIAKIERAGALTHFDEILEAADGIMVARGDLGVEVAIEEMAIIQKRLIAQCNRAGKPVITATQMLESMVANRLPTRAEATDVANAILDGTDCVMLSAESAIGKFPREAVSMLGKIAAAAEANRNSFPRRDRPADDPLHKAATTGDAIAAVVQTALHTVPVAAVFVPTRSGDTARKLSRYKLSAWIVVFSNTISVCQALHFSYGVHPVEVDDFPENLSDFVVRWMDKEKVQGDLAVLVSGPSKRHPEENYSLQFIQTKKTAERP